MIWLNILWFVFAVVFLVLGCFHWKEASKRISHFSISERPLSQMGRVGILGADIDKPLQDFAGDFNNYLDDYNQTTSKQHKMQAIGYWVASIIAVFSFVLVIVS